MNHIIRQQFLQIDLDGTEADGLTLQNRLSALCQHWLMPALEQVLDRCVPPDAYFNVDRLEVDAGIITLDRLEHDLAETVALAVEKIIREQLAAGQSLERQRMSSSGSPLKTGQQTTGQALIYFLQTGQLPWSFRLPAGQNLEQALMNYLQPTTDAVRQFIRDELRPLLMKPTPRQRLIRQFTPGFRQVILHLVGPEFETLSGQLLTGMANAGVSSDDVALLQRHCWETAFEQAIQFESVNERQFVYNFFRQAVRAISQPAALAVWLEQQWPGSTLEQAPSPAKVVMTVKSAETEVTVPAVTGASYSDRVDDGQDEVWIEADGFYMENAGLVILHPFLPRFFAALGLADDTHLIHTDRALCLLHFLATGQRTAPEYDLALPKILCNIPVKKPVESDVSLTDAEIDEADALLRAVIRHWEALRSTLPDGLRGTFLTRPGKLSFRSDGDRPAAQWLLQVEPSSYDILLSQLPWGISMIKLPWMERMLWVEWN